jgi:hypothetical protein
MSAGEIGEGPYVHDVPMEVILRSLYKAKVAALGLEFGIAQAVRGGGDPQK